MTEFVGAYFNTYYNAQRLFSEAEAEVFAQSDARAGGRSYLVPFAIQAATRTKFVSVIEKGSKLLQYHPDSKLVDDALLMIGKSYFYSDEDQKAERKFRELIDGYPDGGLASEARLLLACGKYRMNMKNEAKAAARLVVEEAEKKGEDEFLARAYTLLAQLEFEEKNYGPAADLYKKAAEYGSESEERSVSHLLVADMYQRMEKYHDAELAFSRAEKASGVYSGEYRGRIGLLRMKAKQGQYDAAIDGLRQLRSNSNNREFYGEIDLEVANTYRASGDLPSALNYYNYVDTMYTRTENAAKSYFAKGEIYEKSLYQYDSAVVAYSRGRSEFPQGEIQQQLTMRADYLGRYFLYRGEVARYDSIKGRILFPVDSTARPADSVTTMTGAGDSVRVAVVQKPLLPLDTVNTRLASNKSEIAGLFYATIGLPDSAERWYRRVIVEHPGSPYVPRALFTLAQIYSRDSVSTNPTADSLYRNLIAGYPESDFSAEARRILKLPPHQKKGDEAEGLYIRAEKLMLAGSAETAVDSFKTVVQRYPSSSYSSRALYATGWLYENQLNIPDSALANYERLAMLYPTSPLAVTVQPRLAGVRLEKAAILSRAAADTSAGVPSARPKQPPVDNDEGAQARRDLFKKIGPPLPPAQKPEPVKPEGKEGPTP